MANGNLAACLDITLKHEGGYTANTKDPGNWTGGKVGVGKLKGTKYGIAAASFPTLDIKNLTVAEAREIYGRKYWAPLNGELLPFGVDLATLDGGVNSGVSRAAKWLQAVLGVDVDGKIGPFTIRAITNPKATIQKLCAKRLGFVQGLKTWSTFGKGWARRIADIEARAVAMWLAHAGRQSVPADLNVEASKASKTAAAQDKGAAGTVATGGAGGAADVAANGAVNWWLIGALALAVLVTVGVLAWKARNNKLRAAAYREVGLEAAVGGVVK